MFHEDTGETVFPSVAVKEYDGVPVGFIGMTLEDTPNIVTKSGIEGLKFTDEVETANKVAAQLQKSGVKSIVVLVHEGGFPPAGSTAYNGCPGLSGPIVDINDGLSPRIDAVITGHTHQAYNCTLADPDGAPRLVTSGSSIGRLVTDIDLTINGRSGDVVRSSEVADNHVVTRNVAKAETITTLIAHYKTLVAPIENKVIGHLASAAPITRTQDDSGESALGNLIADSQRADPSTVTGGRTAEIAFMNPGGIRTDLTPKSDGSVTYGAAFAVQPFNNYVVSMDMTGAQILTLLQQQWSDRNTTAAPKILQVSGITYSYAKPSYTLDTSSVQGQRSADRDGSDLPGRRQLVPVRRGRRLQRLRPGDEQVLRRSRHRLVGQLPRRPQPVHPGADRPDRHHHRLTNASVARSPSQDRCAGRRILLPSCRDYSTTEAAGAAARGHRPGGGVRRDDPGRGRFQPAGDVPGAARPHRRTRDGAAGLAARGTAGRRGPGGRRQRADQPRG